MRCLKFTAAIFFTGLLAARAASIPALDEFGNKTEIPIITKAECVKRLEDSFDLKSMIANGIESLNRQGPVSPSCLDELVRDAAASYTLAPPPLPELEVGITPNYPSEKMAELAFLNRKILCADPAAPGSAASVEFRSKKKIACGDAWTSPEEAKEARLKLAAAEEQQREWQKKLSEQEAVASRLADELHPAFQPDAAKRAEINLRLECYNNRDPGPEFEAFAARMKEKCEGRWQTKEQREQASREYAAFAAEEDRKRQEWSDHRRLDKGYLQHLLGSEKIPESALRTRMKESRYLRERDAWLKQQAELARAYPGEKQRALTSRMRDYSRGRLYAKYAAHLNQGGNPFALEDFCGAYARDQERDRRLAANGTVISMFVNAREWKNAMLYGLSEGEFSAIREYTNAFHHEVNPLLNSGRPVPEKMKPYLETLDLALKKLPDFRGDPVVKVSRKSPEDLKDFQEGKVIQYRGYTSTSKNPDWLNNGEIQHHFTFHIGPGAKNIEELSMHPDEEEVLIPAGRFFKVRKRTPTGNPNMILFEMDEVDERGNFLTTPPASR